MPLIQHQNITPQDVKGTLHNLLQASARLYMHFANETLATFGPAGEITIRQHLRDYGRWRGTEMREAHNALGCPINMETLNRCWDSASVFIIKDDLKTTGKYTPYDVVFDVYYCPAAEAWKAEGFERWGHVYCDEFHQACASAYHPDGNVVIPINMMKGDDHCHFRWIMPAAARQIDPFPPSTLGRKLVKYYLADSVERGAYDALVRTNRLLGGRYSTMCRALFALHPPDEAEACMRRALRNWAVQRGRLLRAQHEAQGIEPSARGLFREMDLAVKYVWEIEERTSRSFEYDVLVRWTPMDDAWADLRADFDARMFWRESMPALVEGYDPHLEIEIMALAWDGDGETRLVVRERLEAPNG